MDAGLGRYMLTFPDKAVIATRFLLLNPVD